TLTFVHPQLADRVPELESLGIRMEERQLGEDVFHQVVFRDPAGQAVRLVEARTFSPPGIDPPVGSTCGYFAEFGMPTRDAPAGRAFWEPLGFVALDETQQPFPRTPLASERLNLALYRTRALRGPVL